MLRHRAVDANRRAAELLAARQRAHRPSDVLAGHARSLLLAIERVEALEVLEEIGADLGERRRRGARPRGEEVRDLAEEPRPSLGGAADHDAVGPGRLQ